ncbi:MAG: MFS transporter [Candidatus Sericytochromatia bacterium]
MNTSEKLTSYQIIVIIILAMVQATIILDFAIISPLGEILVKTLNMNSHEFSLVVSAYALSAGISSIISAGFTDRYDRKKFLIFMYMGFIIGTLFCALATNYWQLLIARIVTGIFGGVMGSIVQTIVADVFENKFRGRVMGLIQMSFAVSQILGIPLGLFLAYKLNWNSTFLFIVVLGLVNILLAVFKLKPINEHVSAQEKINPFSKTLQTIKNPKYLLALSSVALVPMGGFMLMPFNSLYAVNNLGVPREKLPLVFLFIGLANLVVMPIIGRLSDKYPRYNIFLIGTIASIIFLNIYTHLLPMIFWLFIIFNMFFFSSIFMRITPFMAMNTTIPELKDRGTYMSLSSALQQAGGGLGAIASGYIISQKSQTSPLQNMGILGYVITFIFLLCLFLVYKLNEQVKVKNSNLA